MLSKTKPGFTLIELMIVVAVIAILVSIAVISYSSIQQRARDNVRSTKLYTVASALESYYDAHGEYPGCPAMTANGRLVVENTLTSLGASEALVLPLADVGVTNSITCDDISSVPADTDAIIYTAEDTPDCQNGAACNSWTLQIRAESNELLSASSRRVAVP